MEWIYTEDKKPIAYRTGNWDGKCSDGVIAEDSAGKQYLAEYNEGFLDGENFKDWYNSSGYLIDAEIVRWLPIPE